MRASKRGVCVYVHVPNSIDQILWKLCHRRAPARVVSMLCVFVPQFRLTDIHENMW